MGGDSFLTAILQLIQNFNPHLRMGGDGLLYYHSKLIQVISIHTSVWEVTCHYLLHNNHLSYFNPHLRMGGDAFLAAKDLLDFYFNPHLRMGGDLR